MGQTMKGQFKRILALSTGSLFIAALLAINGCSRAGSRGGQEPQAASAILTPISFGATPARLERGKYIVETVAHCFMCHSEVEWKAPGAQPVQGKKGAGTRWHEPAMPFLIVPNITPDAETGAGKWTDEQFARAIREGVGHDGRSLFPLMPYMNFSQMSDEDLASVIAYIRSIPAVRNELPKSALPDELKAMIPPPRQVRGPVPSPDLSDPVKRGAYLVTIGNCSECHTARGPEGVPLPGMEFGGGVTLDGPWGKVASRNITPDASGIPYYDEALFIETIRTGQVKARTLNSVMPWGYFRNMTDDDLKAIFAYLRTLKPVKHAVDNTEEPTKCRLCGGTHGYGERN
jgi:mono/diheme cytochrome c family protein